MKLASVKLRPLCKQCFQTKCRRARPLCRRKDNPRNLTCTCSAYHFAHRIGSGRCIHHPDSEKRQFEANTGLKWDGSNREEVAADERRIIRKKAS